MTEDYFIIIFAGLSSLASIFYIPKEKFRLALLSFLSYQVISWSFSLIFIQIGYIAFPVRDFIYATKINFTIFYLFLPGIFTWFMLLFPNKGSILRKGIHYSIFISIIVWFAYFISVYTDLMKFLLGSIAFNITSSYFRQFSFFIICHLFIKWFSKKSAFVGQINV